jgi:hypothetical protein
MVDANDAVVRRERRELRFPHVGGRADRSRQDDDAVGVAVDAVMQAHRSL